MRKVVAGLTALGVAVAVAGGALAFVALGDGGRRVEGYGLALELPTSWEGRISSSPGPSAPQLVAGNFRLPPDNGSVLGQRLPSGGVRLILWDYGPPAYPPPQDLPTVRRADLTGFEGVPTDHTTGSYSFVLGGRLFQLVAAFADTPSDELLAEANEVLRTLEIRQGRG